MPANTGQQYQVSIRKMAVVCEAHYLPPGLMSRDFVGLNSTEQLLSRLKVEIEVQNYFFLFFFPVDINK